MVDESRDEMIRRLKEEIGKLLEDRLPHKGSTIDEIERITEEIGREIEEGVTRQEGRGYVGSLAPCKCGGVAVYKKDYAKSLADSAFSVGDTEGLLPLQQVREGICAALPKCWVWIGEPRVCGFETR